MIRDDSAYLKHILDSVRFIDKYSKKLTVAQFIKDELVQSAIVRQLEIIGEAANLVSKQTKQELKGVEWAKIVGMRNKLIHEYFGVDLNVVWSTIKQELPKLEKELKRYLK
jgi:uncharacterized protein with HEPN domain